MDVEQRGRIRRKAEVAREFAIARSKGRTVPDRCLVCGNGLTGADVDVCAGPSCQLTWFR